MTARGRTSNTLDGAQSAHARGLSAGNKATSHVLRVLAEFIDGAESWGVSDLSRRLDMTKNMVHRALTTLLRHGYVVRDATGSRYQLGLRAAALGSAGMRSLDLPTLVDPYLERLRAISGETVALSVPVGRHQVIIHGVRGHGTVARRVLLGQLTPLHAGPASRVILAHLPDSEIATILAGPLERYTSATLVTAPALWEDIAEIRANGYALGKGDHAPNAAGVSFPILDRDGRPHGAVTVSGPSERFNDEAISRTLPAMKAVSDELNRHSRLFAAAKVSEQDDR
jgi:IclR family transcriptional regulator, acetate operon repressor